MTDYTVAIFRQAIFCNHIPRQHICRWGDCRSCKPGLKLLQQAWSMQAHSSNCTPKALAVVQQCCEGTAEGGLTVVLPLKVTILHAGPWLVPNARAYTQNTTALQARLAPMKSCTVLHRTSWLPNAGKPFPHGCKLTKQLQSIQCNTNGCMP
jgi:hypothetical protein